MKRYPSKFLVAATVVFAAGCGEDVAGPPGPTGLPPVGEYTGVTATVAGDFGTVEFAVPNPDWYDESPGDVTEYLAWRSADAIRVDAKFFPVRETDWEVAGHSIYFGFPSPTAVPATLEIVPVDGVSSAGEAEFDYAQFINVDNVLTTVSGTLVVSELTDSLARGTFTATGTMSDGSSVTIADGQFECELGQLGP